MRLDDFFFVLCAQKKRVNTNIFLSLFFGIILYASRQSTFFTNKFIIQNKIENSPHAVQIDATLRGRTCPFHVRQNRSDHSQY